MLSWLDVQYLWAARQLVEKVEVKPGDWLLRLDLVHLPCRSMSLFPAPRHSVVSWVSLLRGGIKVRDNHNVT